MKDFYSILGMLPPNAAIPLGAPRQDMGPAYIPAPKHQSPVRTPRHHSILDESPLISSTPITETHLQVEREDLTEVRSK